MPSPRLCWRTKPLSVPRPTGWCRKSRPSKRQRLDLMDLDQQFAHWNQFARDGLELRAYRNPTTHHEILNFADALQKLESYAADCAEYEPENASLDFDGWATLGNVTLPEDLPEELREELEGHFSDNYLGELFSDQ